MNRCAIDEKMLKTKILCDNIASRGKLRQRTQEEIPGMICVDEADEKFLEFLD